MTYVLELTKTIVVEVEAKSEQAAVAQATSADFNDDGAFQRAEPQVAVLEVRP